MTTKIKKIKEAKKCEPAEKTNIVPAEEVEKQDVKEVVRIIENRKIEPAEAFGKLSRAQIDLIKRTVAKGASDDELKLFIAVCHGAQLNPFMKQAHLVPFWDSKEGVERRAIIVGIDGFRAIAEGTGAYAGNDDVKDEGEEELSVTLYDKTIIKFKHPTKATATVFKIVAGERYGFSATARWSEYYPGPKKGMQWHKMPYLMLGKCAEALALRKAFPKLLSGIYAQEEMDQATPSETDAKNKQKEDTLNEVIATSTLIQLKGFKQLIVKSVATKKYSAETGAGYLKKVDARIAEIEREEEKEKQKVIDSMDESKSEKPFGAK